MEAKGKTKRGPRPPTLAIDGFRDDMGILLTNFLTRDSYRMEVFVEEWEKMNFGYVFGGTQTTSGGLSEIYQFGEKCFREALNQCIHPIDGRSKVAGLYLLYCLYISRPCSCHARIRINPVVEMKPLLEFVDHLLERLHYDAVYAFLELYEQKSFRYTFTPLEMGYHTQRSKPFRDDRSIHAYTPNIAAFLKCESISLVRCWDRTYATEKSFLPITAEPQLDPTSGELLSLNITANLEEKMMQICRDYDSHILTYENVVLETKEEKDIHSTESEVEPEESIGERRRRLRNQ